MTAMNCYIYFESDCNGGEANRLPRTEPFYAPSDREAVDRSKANMADGQCTKGSLYRFRADNEPGHELEFIASVSK
jgi:hypothetical protein